MNTQSNNENPLRDLFPKVEPELKEIDAIPLTGSSPPFPWNDLSKRLSKLFEREISIEPGEIKWRTEKELYEGLGDHPIPLNFSVSSLKGGICWVMPEAEISLIESLILTKEASPIQFQDPSLTESFYRFLALEFIYQMSQAGYDSGITPILTSANPLPKENSLCLDVCLKIEQHSLWGRLVISQAFRKSWVDYFAKKGPSSRTKEIKKHIHEKVHFEVGKAIINYDEWQKVNVGDCILLDTCALKKDGKVVLSINGKAIRHALLEGKKLKII